MRTLVLFEVLASGQVVEYPLTDLKVLSAQHGATYSVIDKNTGQIPKDLILVREGDTLEALLEHEQVVQIEEFYGENTGATYNLDGSSTPAADMVINSSDVATITDGSSQVVWQAASSDAAGVSPWIWGGGVLAGAGLLAAAAGGGGGGGGNVSEQTVIGDTTAPTLQSSTPLDDATAIALNSSIILTFNENIAIGAGDIVISDGTDTRTIDVNDGSQVSVSGSVMTIDPTDDLDNNSSTYHVEIAAGAITDTAGNSYVGIADDTTINFDTVAAINTNIVVFDLVHGVSSSHNGGSGESRTFDENVAYTIYVMVDSDSEALNTTPTTDAATDATWGSWVGAETLGDDDMIVITGNGSGIYGPEGYGTVSQVYEGTSFMWVYALNSRGAAVVIGKTGDVIRHFDTGTDSASIFSGPIPDMRLNTGTALYANAIPTTPVNILTTQGLI